MCVVDEEATEGSYQSLAVVLVENDEVRITLMRENGVVVPEIVGIDVVVQRQERMVEEK